MIGGVIGKAKRDADQSDELMDQINDFLGNTQKIGSRPGMPGLWNNKLYYPGYSSMHKLEFAPDWKKYYPLQLNIINYHIMQMIIN